MPLPNRETKLSNKDAAAIYQDGLAAYETGRFLDAIGLLCQIAESSNLAATLARFYLSQAHLQQGLFHLRAGQHADSARHLTAAQRLNPESAGMSRYLIQCHVGQRRFDLAAATIEREHANDQSSADAT